MKILPSKTDQSFTVAQIATINRDAVEDRSSVRIYATGSAGFVGIQLRTGKRIIHTTVTSEDARSIAQAFLDCCDPQ